MDAFYGFWDHDKQIKMNEKINRQEIVNIDLIADDNFHFVDINNNNKPVSIENINQDYLQKYYLSIHSFI